MTTRVHNLKNNMLTCNFGSIEHANAFSYAASNNQKAVDLQKPVNKIYQNNKQNTDPTPAVPYSYNLVFDADEKTKKGINNVIEFFENINLIRIIC